MRRPTIECRSPSQADWMRSLFARHLRLILRENTMNSLVMIQPALLPGPWGAEGMARVSWWNKLFIFDKWAFPIPSSRCGIWQISSECLFLLASNWYSPIFSDYWCTKSHFCFVFPHQGSPCPVRWSNNFEPAPRQYSFEEGPPQPVLLDATSLKCGTTVDHGGPRWTMGGPQPIRMGHPGLAGRDSHVALGADAACWLKPSTFEISKISMVFRCI